MGNAKLVRCLVLMGSMLLWGGEAIAGGACYFQGSNGRVTDLSALCGITKPQPGVFRSPIKRRKGRTPVIDVTFETARGSQTYEMILDTGASGTVITGVMATALGISQVAEARINTASERGVRVPLGYVNRIEVASISAQNILVAIQPALEIGLLGHDFFGDLEITVKRDVVEFRLPR
ncbi:MAG: retropepsin-like aspartic protease [Pseudanabaenaceae cyanobacterium bins.68]|nr:retropepsin-like aspartic protease [Pseudanabaenaceae cyanobacterium bins.68]